jgi:hypothetical protein
MRRFASLVIVLILIAAVMVAGAIALPSGGGPTQVPDAARLGTELVQSDKSEKSAQSTRKKKQKQRQSKAKKKGKGTGMNTKAPPMCSRCCDSEEGCKWYYFCSCREEE